MQAWPPLVKLVGYEHRRTQWGVQEMSNTHTHSVPRDTQGGWSLGQGSETILLNVGVAPPLIKFLAYEHREDALGGEGAGNGKHTLTHPYTHTNTHSVPRDTHCGLCRGQ